MSNIYILSNELCDFCNVPHGSKMHIKQIVRIIEDYIKDNKLHDYLNANIRCIYFNDTLKKIFCNIDSDEYTIKLINEYFMNEINGYEKYLNDYIESDWLNKTILVLEEKINKLRKEYKESRIETQLYNMKLAPIQHEEKLNDFRKLIEDAKNRHDQFKIYTHNFNDIDMYLEMSGHLTPVLKSETHTLLNEISHKIEHVKSLVSYNDDAGNHLEEVNKLLKELEDMYHNK